MTKQEQKDAALKAYRAIQRPAWEAYRAIKVPALEAYEAIQEPAWKDYKAIQVPANEAYEAIEVPAWKAYKAEIARIDSEPDNEIIEVGGKSYQLIK